MKDTLELIEKYGIKPLLFIAVLYLYSENNQNKQDIKEVQSLLVDCYKQQVIRVASLSKDYVKYGQRGILMCDEWRNDFRVFYEVPYRIKEIEHIMELCLDSFKKLSSFSFKCIIH